MTDQRDELPAYTAEVAQLWCRPELSDREMDVEFAEAIRSLLLMEVTKAAGAARDRERDRWEPLRDAQAEVIAAQTGLLGAYRIGSQVMADAALTRLAVAREALAAVEEPK
jgi:anti-sigma factor RsiW